MLGIMSYSCEVKISGKHVSVKKYSRERLFNYEEKKGVRVGIPKGSSNRALENFARSSFRARKRIFDLIACNVNAIPDFFGNMQMPKFWTLTFADNVTDLKTANKAFTDFNKRLSYHLYKVNKNVLKYVCIPEFQKRGAVHYHVLYFNLPYLDHKEFESVWSNGFVFVESVKDSNKIENFAKYVCKYISKENSKGESNFLIYKEKDMLNNKRYFSSRGLNKPCIYKLNVDKKLYSDLLVLLNDYHESNHEYSNEYIGDVELNNYVVKKDMVQALKGYVNLVFNRMKNMYDVDEWNLFRRIMTFKKEDKAILLDLIQLGWV